MTRVFVMTFQNGTHQKEDRNFEIIITLPFSKMKGVLVVHFLDKIKVSHLFVFTSK